MCGGAVILNDVLVAGRAYLAENRSIWKLHMTEARRHPFIGQPSPQPFFNGAALEIRTFEIIVQSHQVAVKRQHELSPENIVNLLWAYAKLMAPSAAELFPPLMEARLISSIPRTHGETQTYRKRHLET